MKIQRIITVGLVVMGIVGAVQQQEPETGAQEAASGKSGQQPTAVLSEDYSGKDMSGRSFAGAIFEKAKADETTQLIEADFTGAVLKNVEFKKIQGAQSIFREARLYGVDFSGADMTKSNMSNMITDGNCIFDRAVFKDATLSGATLSGNYKKAVFDGANLYGASLHGSMQGASFVGAYFDKTDIRGADFTGANFKDATGLNSVIKDSTTKGFPG